MERMDQVAQMERSVEKQRGWIRGANPFLPPWEYIPDGEPHVFGDRVYLYGSHDRFNGHAFCLNDYMCYSAPVEDLTDWRCEGVIYGRGDDPRNADGDQCLYAPDVCRGADGRYYLYYVLDASSVVSVAVCDTPAGRYRFYGYVKDSRGGILGERQGDEAQFDPAVFCEDGQVYLYTGFCAPELGRSGAMVTVLEPDMLTVREEPRFIIPSAGQAQGTSFAEHAFFEAASIRKVGKTWYFLYSSVLQHELCYATSASPTEGFTYRGVVISNVDRGIGSYKAPEMEMAFRDNNHGSIERINGRWYVFYHRHTNSHSFSRQACLEMICIEADGSIRQVEMTSAGPLGGILPGVGTYPGYLACNLWCEDDVPGTPGMPGKKRDPHHPFITQEGKDGDEVPGHIENMDDGTMVGFKYFACAGSALTAVITRGWTFNGRLEVLTAPGGEVLGSIPIRKSNDWKRWEGFVPLPDGRQAIFLRYRGEGYVSLSSFSLTRNTSASST